MIDPLPSCDRGIVIDGVGLHSVAREEVRDRIIAMSQDPVFLPGHISLKRQLDPRKISTPTECVAVLQLVGLNDLANDVADLEVPLHPETLSGGQKQLFNLARTVLRRRAHSRHGNCGERAGGLLLLDEVSASMDHETERVMQRVIMNEFGSCTIIMVSHRLEMAMDFDTVLVMEHGRVVERGSPKALTLDEGSHFRRLLMAGGHSTGLELSGRAEGEDG